MNIVAEIKSGNEFVFQQVFNQYHNKLYFFIYEKTKSNYLTEEVVQIAFVKLWEHRETLNEAFTISTQLFRIASTSLIDLLRQQNTRTVLLKTLEQGDAFPAENKTFENLQEKELSQTLSFTLSTLPPIRRKVFEMSRFSGLSYREIAQNLSISPKTVETHISKALKQIKKQLKGWLIILHILKDL